MSLAGSSSALSCVLRNAKLIKNVFIIKTIKTNILPTLTGPFKSETISSTHSVG